MLSRNSFLFKGFIRQSIWKPWSLSSMGKRTVLNENVLQLIKNGNIISNQKNITGINLLMKGELRCTSKLTNILSPNSIITDSNDEKIVEKQEEAVFEKNQSVCDIIESIPIKRNCDILQESDIPATSKLPTQQYPKAATSSIKILHRSDFEIVNHPKKDGEPTRTLIIPISKDCPYEEILCNTFCFCNTYQKFICNQPQEDGKRASAKLPIKDEEEIIELSNYNNLGEPVLYKEVMEKLTRLQNLEYEIIEKPYFEIQENGSRYNKPLLTVYINKDQSLGYEFYKKDNIFYCNTCYSKHKIYVSAKLIIRKDGTTEIRMGKHVCEPIDVTKITVREPNYFKLKNDQLFILLSKESNMGYRYNLKDDNIYVCKSKGCSASAKCFQDEDQNEYFELSKTEHICEPIQYQCDISEIEQFDLEWPKLNEGIEECENLITIIQECHPIGKYPLYASTYVITSAPPEITPERKASCILYVGYSENCETRKLGHVTQDCVVSELLTKFGTLFMIPILNDNPLACYDLEALIYQLWKCGSLKFQLRNRNKCSWKSNGEEGSLQFISKNPDDPRHADLVLGVKKFLITEIAKVQPDYIIILTSDKKSESTS